MLSSPPPTLVMNESCCRNECILPRIPMSHTTNISEFTHKNTSCHTYDRVHRNTPQHTATHCNTLQHTATHYYMSTRSSSKRSAHTSTPAGPLPTRKQVCCSVLQCVAVSSSALYCVAASHSVVQCVAVPCICTSWYYSVLQFVYIYMKTF